jgi:hypothetical protein
LYFSEISEWAVSGLSFWAFSAVVAHEALAPSSKDWCFEVISKRIRCDTRCFELLQFVRLEFLSLEYFTKFFDLVRDSFDHFVISHWKSLHVCLLILVSPARTNERPHDSEVFSDLASS